MLRGFVFFVYFLLLGFVIFLDFILFYFVPSRENDDVLNKFLNASLWLIWVKTHEGKHQELTKKELTRRGERPINSFIEPRKWPARKHCLCHERPKRAQPSLCRLIVCAIKIKGSKWMSSNYRNFETKIQHWKFHKKKSPIMNFVGSGNMRDGETENCWNRRGRHTGETKTKTRKAISDVFLMFLLSTLFFTFLYIKHISVLVPRNL